MRPRQTPLQTIRELAEADPEFALELAVSPRVALARVQGMLGVDNHAALAAHFNELALTGFRGPFERGPVSIGQSHTESQIGGSGSPGTSGQDQPPLSAWHRGMGPLYVQDAPPPQPATVELGTKLDHSSLPLKAYWKRDVDANATYFEASEHWPFYGNLFQPPLASHALLLPDGRQPIGATLRAPGATMALPVEAQLFARDPEELGFFVSTLPLVPEDIARQIGGPFAGEHGILTAWTRPGTVPDAVALLMPYHVEGKPYPHPALPPSENTQWPLTIPDFFQGNTPYGAAAAPFGTSNIKAVKIQAAGACTSEIKFADIYDGTTLAPSGSGSGFSGVLTKTMQELCDKGLDTATLNYMAAAPIIRRTHDSNARGQFFLNMDATITAHVEQFFGIGCSLRASALFDVGLDNNGALVLTLNPSNIKVAGYAGGTCEDIFTPFIPNQPIPGLEIFGPKSLFKGLIIPYWITSSINQVLRTSQSFGVGDVTATDKDLAKLKCDPTRFERFDPNVPGNALIPYSDGGALLARDALCNLIREGYVSQGFMPNGPPANSVLDGPGCAIPAVQNVDEKRLQLLFAAVNATDADGNLVHWTCPTPCRATENANVDLKPHVEYPFVLQRIRTDLKPSFPNCCKSTLLSLLPSDQRRFMSPDSCGDGTRADPTQSVYTFVPAARRVIMNPDSVQLVLYDNEDAWDSSGLAAKYALIGELVDPRIAGARGVLPLHPSNAREEAQSQLCSYVRPVLGGKFHRAFEPLIFDRPVGCSVFAPAVCHSDADCSKWHYCRFVKGSTGYCDQKPQPKYQCGWVTKRTQDGIEYQDYMYCPRGMQCIAPDPRDDFWPGYSYCQ